LPPAIETLIVRLKKDYPTWGAPKIREQCEDNRHEEKFHMRKY